MMIVGGTRPSTSLGSTSVLSIARSTVSSHAARRCSSRASADDRAVGRDLAPRPSRRVAGDRRRQHDVRLDARLDAAGVARRRARRARRVAGRAGRRWCRPGSSSGAGWPRGSPPGAPRPSSPARPASSARPARRPLALGLDRFAAARLASSRFASSRLRGLGLRVGLGRSASSRRPARARRARSRSAHRRRRRRRLGLDDGRRRLRGSTTGGAASARAASARGAAVCGTADQSSATTPSGSLAFQCTLQASATISRHVREERERQPRAHAGRLLRREHVALEGGGVHRVVDARLSRCAGS